MRGKTLVHAHRLEIGALVLLLANGAVTSTSAQETRKTIWDGVYTPAQSARGYQTYRRSCGSCHGVDLKGGVMEGAPALIGASFMTRYQNRPLSELFQTIAETMPQDAPGSLDAQASADVVSYLLKKQLVPGGDTELTTDPQQLKDIFVTQQQ